jgi:hypothetical protein
MPSCLLGLATLSLEILCANAQRQDTCQPTGHKKGKIMIGIRDHNVSGTFGWRAFIFSTSTATYPAAKFLVSRRSWGRAVVVMFLLMAMMTGCASAPRRNPLPANLSDEAVVPGYSNYIRYWGDGPPPYMEKWYTASEAEIEHFFPDIIGQDQIYLAVSGGGANGAYGVGILTGWSAAGTRPEFTMVTGISTGSLIAPFAFLGPEYDARLKEAYTSVSTKDIADRRSLLATLQSDAAADTAPLKAHIARYIDQEIIAAIAREHRRGRRLFIGTTNLDAMRPVLWNIGRIAASGREDAGDLIRSILLASASIPGVFPPQYITVQAGGKRYDEIHVDGGAVSQAFLYPLGYDWRIVQKRLKVKSRPRGYIIRNSRLRPDWVAVDPPKTLKIAGRSISSMIRSQGIGDLYRIYLSSLRDDIDYFWTSIPDDFGEKPKEMFDPEYMLKLVEIGTQRIQSGTAWQATPPGYKVR